MSSLRLLLVAAGAGVAAGQTPLSFEVASVRVATNRGVSKMTFRMSTPQALLGFLQFQLGRARTEDKTGLTGKYDFQIEFSTAGLPGPGAGGYGTPRPPDVNAETDPAPDLFSALEKQLGLRLEKGKTQLDVIVVDRFDKQPEEN